MQYRTKKILSSKFRRVIRWEFWPVWVFYIPLVFYAIYLTIRFRGLTFLSVNPGLPMSGLIGERKAKSLLHLKGSPYLARFELLQPNSSIDSRVKEAKAIMNNFDVVYPVVLKPDFGQRGADVAVIRSELELRSYLQKNRIPILVQEYIGGEEFGVFYMRYPKEERSLVYSITEKTFPVVVGDGKSTLEELLMNNSRTHYMAEFLLDLHKDKLTKVFHKGERFKVVEIGSHCRGSVFLDGNKYITPELEKTIDEISQKIEGFNFGRYDIRVENASLLSKGEGIKVLEVNGVTSESTNMYDPNNSVFDAYKVLFNQWREAYEIGAQAIKKGSSAVSVFGFFQHLKKTYW